MGASLLRIARVHHFLPDVTKREAALIEFEYATEYRRDHPLVTMLGTELGLTEEQIDGAFVVATNL